MNAASQNTDETTVEKPPLSVERLRQAFSRMLGHRTQAPTAEEQAGDETAPSSGNAGAASLSEGDCQISPRSIVEAMLFVGRPDGQPLAVREMAATMRDVSPGDVEAAIESLNETYQQDGSPYAIVRETTGYRLKLRDEFRQVRDKFQRRVREARLAPAALEVLSIVAYHQPITLETIDQIRGVASGGVLRLLVRRELVRLERPPERKRSPDYYTTQRFLKLFGLGTLDDLPRHSEMKVA